MRHERGAPLLICLPEAFRVITGVINRFEDFWGLALDPMGLEPTTISFAARRSAIELRALAKPPWAAPTAQGGKFCYALDLHLLPS
jgi:hypothetical protein